MIKNINTLLSEVWNFHQFAISHGGFVGADAGGGPVGGGEDVDGGAAVFDDAAGEFVDKMRMGAMVAAGDFKCRRWIQIVVFAGTGERRDLLRQHPTCVGSFKWLSISRIAICLGIAGVQYFIAVRTVAVAPVDGAFFAIDGKAFAVASGGLEEGARHFESGWMVFKTEDGGFSGKWIVIERLEIVPHDA